MARMTNDLNAVRMLLGPAIMYSANTVLFSIGALYFLLRISPWLTLVALVPLPLVSILVQSLGLSLIHISSWPPTSSVMAKASPRTNSSVGQSLSLIHI